MPNSANVKNSNIYDERARLIRINVLYLHISCLFFYPQARFVSVSEFATPSPFLSMAMLEAGVKRVSDKHTLGEDDSEDDSEDEEIDQTTSREATVINFLLVQPKSLQV